MAIFLSVLSAACFIGAAVSLLRYDSKHFDLLVLSCVIFLSAAIPSFEVDASLEELKSINHRLINVQNRDRKTPIALIEPSALLDRLQLDLPFARTTWLRPFGRFIYALDCPRYDARRQAIYLPPTKFVQENLMSDLVAMV